MKYIYVQAILQAIKSLLTIHKLRTAQLWTMPHEFNGIALDILFVTKIRYQKLYLLSLFSESLLNLVRNWPW